MLTKFALKNNVVTLSILVVIMLSGGLVFDSLSRDDMPPFLIRVVSIVTSYPGASPERVESLITDKIEKVAQEIPEMSKITSESRNGISIVNVTLKESEFVLQPIFDRIRRKVEGIKKDLPEGSHVIIKDELGDVFGIIIGLTAKDYSFAETKKIADEIRNELIKLPDAAKVEIRGAQDERIFIEFSDSKLTEFGLSKNKVQGIINQLNIVIPGGAIELDGRRISLEPTGSFETINDLKNTIILSNKSNIIRLRDVTEIFRGYVNPKKEIVRINGKQGIAIAVNLKKGGNIINLGKLVDQKIHELKKIYPYGVEIERVASQDLVVEKSIDDFLSNLIQSIVVVLLVMLIFLGFRTGIVVASLIPATMVMTLLIMGLLGIGLNKVTLASKIIALGMLVDNAIVVSEAIMVKMSKGKEAFDAAVEAAQELLIPLLTSSLTTSAAFMAFYLAESVMGEIMGKIFIVVTISLLCSWVLSLTMITLFCVYGLKIEKTESDENSGFFGKIKGYYQVALEKCLRHRFAFILAVVLCFMGSIWLMQFVPVIFMAKSDRALVTANFEFPLGTSITITENMVKDVEKFIKTNLKTDDNRKTGVESWSSYIGEGAPKYDLGYTAPESSPNAAHVLLNTTGDSVNDEVIKKLDEYVFNNYPDLTYKISRLASGGGAANPIEIRLAGNEISGLFALAEKIKSQLRSMKGPKNISDSWGQKTKKFMVKIDTIQAQIAGITNQDIAISLQTILSGAQIGTFREEENSIPIIMRNLNANSLKIGELETITILSQQSGKTVPLKQVAEINVVWESPKILRRDLTRTLTVTSDITSEFTAAEVVAVIKPWLVKEAKNWAQGYSYELGGDAESSGDAMGAVSDKLPLSMFIIVLLLIGQFNSLRKPAIILLTVPLGLIGVILGLWIAGSYFGFMGFLGIISLAGIVINNGIVLIDRIDIEINENGLDPNKAIIAAALQRFRPILLTTATTSVGLVPLWLGGGLMWEPMAIGIIFGLLFATVLTLAFVPVLYSLFFRVKIA